MAEIGEASRLSGVGIETIRFYEREGVIPPAARAANGRRQYSRDDIGRLRFLKRCRDLGFPLSDAKTLLDLSRGQEADCASASRIAQHHCDEIRRTIAELHKLQCALDELTENCSEGNTDCPMLARLREF